MIESKVMHDVCWSLAGKQYTDRSTFEAELVKYQFDIRKVVWDPSEIVLNAKEIRVRYKHYVNEEEVRSIITLAAGNGAAFSAGELMFLLHNAVCEQLSSVDRHFFEGMVLANEQEDGLPPLYLVWQGS